MLSIEPTLWDITYKLFRKLGCSVEDCREYSVDHPDDKRIALIIRSDYVDDSIGVIILDWNRVVGITQILKAQQVLERGNWDFSKLAIVSRKGFSQQSENLANKLNIRLLTEGHLQSVMLQDISKQAKTNREIASGLIEQY